MVVRVRIEREFLDFQMAQEAYNFLQECHVQISMIIFRNYTGIWKHICHLPNN